MKTTNKTTTPAPVTPNENAQTVFPYLLKAIKKEYDGHIKRNPQEKSFYIKCYNDAVKKVEKVATAQTLTECKISVEWIKNRVWGYNPRATVDGFTIDENGARDYMRTTARASGCGYDKQSTAIASALNDNPAILKLLYITDEKRLRGIKSRKIARRDFIGYGAGYGARPYFEGGCGVSCFYEIFKNCGYTFKQVASGKTFDAYTITKNENKKGGGKNEKRK